MGRTVLGISAYFHDAAACIVRDGRIAAAAQEERFTRKKHDPRFPSRAIAAVLNTAGCSVNDLDAVVFYDKPFLKFNRLLETYLTYAPSGVRSFIHAMPSWLGEKLWLSDLISEELQYTGKVLFAEHHESHAASAFFPSPFERAVIVTVDGVGEYATSSIAVGDRNRIDIIREQHFPHSLGLLYSAFTYVTGFKVNSGEYKVMGLAPYGVPRYAKIILEQLIDLKDDGSFSLNMDYFDFATGLRMTNSRFDALFDGPPRTAGAPLTQREMDLAASVQAVTEEIMLRIIRYAKQLTGEQNLCLAGGVALNCVANGKILRSGLFHDLWIQPASGDAGGALGAALIGSHQYFKEERNIRPGDAQSGSYLGNQYSDAEITAFLDGAKIPYTQISDQALLCKETATLLSQEKVIGWFQGRMEFGPRALGNRSILGDARSASMQRTMNLKIKYRESFRPFAPAVLSEHAADWFDLDRPSPYMLLVADVRKEHRVSPEPNGLQGSGTERVNQVRSSVPAITHIDHSARVQTVDGKTNPLFHQLLSEFRRLTGCPMIVNTSFNVRGEPIVESPEDAYRCFMRTEMDVLILGSCVLIKTDQPPYAEQKDWRETHELD
jgi:carbamoyltransferase